MYNRVKMFAPYSTAKDTVYVTTLPVRKTARNLSIVLELIDRTMVDTNHTFEYRNNPVFTDIRPRNHLVVGGTQVTVYGSNLYSVAEPRIIVDVVITTFHEDTNSSTSTTERDSEPCNLPQREANGRELLCRMPVVSLPEYFTRQLEQSISGTIDGTDGSGVAVYWASKIMKLSARSRRSDSGLRARADIYIGLEMDGDMRWLNISAVNDTIKMQFALSPHLMCKSDAIEFDPKTNKVIGIKGQHLQRGSGLVDFSIKVGNAACIPVSLTDNQVDCRPPSVKPNRNVHDTFCHDDLLSLQVMIGNEKYHCSCVRYVSEDHIMFIIIGVAIGIALLLIIVIVVIVLLCRRCRSKQARQESSGYRDNIPMDQAREYEDKNMYSRHLPRSEIGDSPKYTRHLPRGDIGHSRK